MVMVGLAIGARGGIILAGMKEGLLGGLRNKEQVEDALGITYLGWVPKLKRSRRTRYGAPLMQPQHAVFGHAIRNVQLKLLGHHRHSDSRVIFGYRCTPLRRQDLGRCESGRISGGRRASRSVGRLRLAPAERASDVRRAAWARTD